MPEATDVIITGSMEVGATLTVSYQYTGDNQEGATEFQRYRNGEAIIGETSNTYTLLLTDQSYEIICAVCPIDDQGNVGEVAYSEALEVQYYPIAEPVEKQYIVKLYDSNMAFIKVLPAGLITNDISFTESIDAGQGELSLNINLPIDTSYFNGVRYCKVFVSDNTGINDLLIYTGWLSKVSRVFSNNKENIQATFLSIYSLMEDVILKNGSGDVNFSKTGDPADILKFIIDYFTSIYPGILSYDASSIDSYGSNITIQFDGITCAKAVQNLVNDLNYYVYIGADGVVNFHDTPGSAIHKLTYEKDVTALTVPEDREQIVNKITVMYEIGDSLYYTDPAMDNTSITNYGVKEVLLGRQDLKTQASAELYRDQYLQDNKDIKENIDLVVNTLYPIENIHPGDTVKIRNLDLNIVNLQVSKVTYKYEQVQLQIGYYKTLAQEIFNT